MEANKTIMGTGKDRPTDLPDFFVEGIDQVIEKDLALAKANVEKAKIDLNSHKMSNVYHLEKKAHYRQLIRERKNDQNKYNLNALIEARDRINVDLKSTANHIKYAEERIEHHGNIVKTLTENLRRYHENYDKIRKARTANGPTD